MFIWESCARENEGRVCEHSRIHKNTRESIVSSVKSNKLSFGSVLQDRAFLSRFVSIRTFGVVVRLRVTSGLRLYASLQAWNRKILRAQVRVRIIGARGKVQDIYVTLSRVRPDVRNIKTSLGLCQRANLPKTALIRSAVCGASSRATPDV